MKTYSETSNQSVTKTTESQLLQARKNSITDSNDIEHRLELVAEINGVEYVNDSKATDVSSTWYSLQYMNKPVVWIIGTSEMETDYSLFFEVIEEKVKAIICFGRENESLIKAFENKVDSITTAETVEEVTQKSASLSEEGDIVLFSPACSSFDVFLNYKARGLRFRQAVSNL